MQPMAEAAVILPTPMNLSSPVRHSPIIPQIMVEAAISFGLRMHQSPIHHTSKTLQVCMAAAAGSCNPMMLFSQTTVPIRTVHLIFQGGLTARVSPSPTSP